MTGRSLRHRICTWVIAPLALVGVASAVVTTASAEAVPGSAGTDTSLPATDSQVKDIPGRGPFKDLRITVNQTKNLLNQTVSITWTGGNPTAAGQPSRWDSNFLQIMQCWGDPDTLVPENPGPPAEQCVQGARTGSANFNSAGAFSYGFSTTRLISRPDWPNFDAEVGKQDPSGNVWLPFRAVNGTVVDIPADTKFVAGVTGGSYWLNPFFGIFTTNEIVSGRTGLIGTGAELMQLNTGLQSSGLGCGQRVQPIPGGDTKIPQCWIVVVPRGEPADENAGTSFGLTPEEAAGFGVYTSPVSPEVWKNRIAIPIEFSPVDSPCDLGVGERRIAGSELALPAVTSWQPELCASGELPPYSFAPLPDSLARQQIVNAPTGAPGMVAVSRPVPIDNVDPANPIVYAPLSASGLVIGFNVERRPKPSGPTEEQQLAGVRVADMNLTPRLVAKLLTQSYGAAVSIGGVAPQGSTYGWLSANPTYLAQDPDFLRFNPEFELLQADSRTFSGLQLPLGNSDAALQVWEWVLSDPEARAWLDGAADEWGMTINPLYSTNVALNPSGSAFGDPVPTSFAKADPYCYQAPLTGLTGKVVPPLLCGSDWQPYARSFSNAAEIARAASDGARINTNVNALSAAEVWTREVPQAPGQRAMLALTDTPSAARFGLQTARLSRAGDNGDDRSFVAPNSVGLAKGVESMVPSDEPTVLIPSPLGAQAGAYPLTALTYAAIAPLALDAQERAEYAAFLEYAAGPGQEAGVERGQLPVGYSTLPVDLRLQTVLAAFVVRELTAAPIAPITPPTDPPTTTQTVSPTSPATAGSEGGSSAAPSPPSSSRSGGTARSSSSSGSSASTPIVDSVPVADAPVTSEVAAAEPAPTVVVDEFDEEVGSSGSPLMTPILAIGRSRYAIPGVAIVALISMLGALEISKRPRKRLAEDDAAVAADVGVLVDA